MSLRSRSALIAFILLLLQSAFAHAGAPREYPLQVHVFSRRVHHNHRFGAFYGTGRANLIDGDKTYGVEFTYDCLYKFLDSEGDDFYPARWKHEGLSLEIVMGVIGSDTATHTCEFKVAIKDFLYHREHGRITTISPEEYSALNYARQEHAQALNPVDLDQTHYPLQLSVLHVVWTGSNGGNQIGTGQGNLRTATGLSAVDFSLHCPVKIQPTPEGRYLLGQWLEPNTHMLLLLRSIDVDGAPGATCELTTVIDPDVYVRSGGGVKAISQEEYRKRNP